ncbi:MAG TPA: phosphatidylserine decarboxylase [Terriglobales bacterium]|nr:phosphatidylserine decarboxylase [Terriglobales bacterium]
MVRDAYYYSVPLIAAAVLLGWLTSPAWAIIPLVLAAFLLWFFRDPERTISDAPGAIVSPADGKITDVALVSTSGGERYRISIFLNVFDVHVNRSPIAGTIRKIRYQRGEFLNAMGAASAEQNEQNIVDVEGEGHSVTFKQIAGLIARRIVFDKKVGDAVTRGERVGMIKFGSRTDVLLDPTARLNVKVGERVKGGASILAFLPAADRELVGAGRVVEREGGR